MTHEYVQMPSAEAIQELLDWARSLDQQQPRCPDKTCRLSGHHANPFPCHNPICSNKTHNFGPCYDCVARYHTDDDRCLCPMPNQRTCDKCHCNAETYGHYLTRNLMTCKVRGKSGATYQVNLCFKCRNEGLQKGWLV
jgi:hypothetical protein